MRRRPYTSPRDRKASNPENSETGPAFVSVFDGRDCVGFVLSRGKLGFEAFHINGRSCGFFATTREAAAIPIPSKGAAP
jgi:hypothetical protein